MKVFKFTNTDTQGRHEQWGVGGVTPPWKNGCRQMMLELAFVGKFTSESREPRSSYASEHCCYETFRLKITTVTVSKDKKPFQADQGQSYRSRYEIFLLASLALYPYCWSNMQITCPPPDSHLKVRSYNDNYFQLVQLAFSQEAFSNDHNCVVSKFFPGGVSPQC